jgi:hypothetical protein
LKMVCKYSPRNDGSECCECLRNTAMGKYMELPYSREQIEEMLKNSLSWLYYASATPIWSQRLESHKGVPNHQTKAIVFNNNIMKFAFLNKYGYI